MNILLWIIDRFFLFERAEGGVGYISDPVAVGTQIIL